jgi:Ser/Thr protein kinase RdoA (MazF antagonist)
MSSSFSPSSLPAAVLAAWSLDPARIEVVSAGHINQTFFAYRRDGPCVVQRVNPIFGKEVHHDIAAITEHLAASGLPTPRLIETRSKALYLDDESGVWRALTKEPGTTILRAQSAAHCHEAGRALGRLHRALERFDKPLLHERLAVHDTRAHLQTLKAALDGQRDHRRYETIAPLASDILQRADALDLDAINALAPRVVHGDPKISNLLFDAQGNAGCWVDLDTWARMPVTLEIGDALRSWCAPHGEEAIGEFSLAFYEAALTGYRQGAAELLCNTEWQQLASASECIALELAARFCADALLESYFGWDQRRFASASEHNELRTRSQLALARSIAEKRARLQGILRDVFLG